MSDLDDALITFKQETQELLVDMELGLLNLEDNPADEESINSVFRAMHTIKGTSGLFGFDPIVSFTHHAETVLDQVRKGNRGIDSQLISVLLLCQDHTAQLIEFCLAHYPAELTPALQAKGAELLSKLQATDGASSTSTLTTQPEIAPDPAEVIAHPDNQPDDNWMISLKFKANAFRNGMDPLPFIRYLKTLGEIVDVITLFPELPSDNAIDPESCYLQFKIAFKSKASKQTIEGVFEFAEDDCDISIIPPHSEIDRYLELLQHHTDAALNPEFHTPRVQKLGDMLIQIGVLTPKEVAKALEQQKLPLPDGANKAPRLGEILIEQNISPAPIVEQALKKQQQVQQKIAAEANFIRVDSTKLGQLINLVGELVISGAAMRLMVDRHGLSDVEEVVLNMNNLVSDIRTTALELRMVPIGETFSRFKRVVRDVSKELKKDIELDITGGETELDKTIVEKINDPLTHLIRNSLDHGIELPEERLAKGKPAQGLVSLNAFHDSGNVVIQISDDGAGLHSDKIRAKAIANGLITPEQVLSQQEIFNLIFAAGLSTKDQVNNLSGRGVGMDVVRRNIEALRGSIDLQSVAGQGTTTTIRLPLTLAIIDGFMVEAETERYIIPLSMIEECVEMDTDDNDIKFNRIQHYVNLRGEVMPYLRLGDYLHQRAEHLITHSQQQHKESMVVVRSGQAKIGLVVDELHGEHQTVIKPLGKIFETLKGISGATVLGSGDVALILDVQGLIQHANKHHARLTIPMEMTLQ